VNPTFFGLEPDLSTYDSSRAAVFGLPFGASVSYGRGAEKGPAAIMEASQQVELFDHELGYNPCDAGIATVAPELLETPLMSHGEVKEAIARILPGLLDDGKFPVMLGGDHSVTPPMIEVFRARYPKLGVLQIDAHADLRDSYDEDPESHACAMRRALDHDLSHLVGVGIRNISEPEWEYLQTQSKVTEVWGGSWLKPWEEWCADVDLAIAQLPEHVYLTIDVDGLDPSIMPSTGTPEPGGLTWQHVCYVLAQLFESRTVVGMDINELAPIDTLHGPDFLVAKLMYRAIGLKFRGFLARK
jgi:agmatinase